MNWTDRREQLPPPGEEALWIYETDEMALHAREDGDDMSGHEPDITHWMLLPAPPKRETT